MDERKLRIGRNEAAFREVNERLRELGEGFSLVSEPAEFVCECGDASCAKRVQLTLSEYEHVRSDPKWFFVLPGHGEASIERVIEQHDDYWIVEKLPGGPAGIAIKDDPRG